VAKFLLNAAHCLSSLKGPVLVESGTEVESADYINFACSPHMTALDDEAQAMLQVECDRLRAEAKNFGVVIGYGSTQTLPLPE